MRGNERNCRRWRALMLAGVGATALLAGGAQAAPDTTAAAPASATPAKATPAPDEIVVTATRQEQSISKVPASIAAFTQQGMDREGVKDIEDVVRLTPGISFTEGAQANSPGRSAIAIRGISSSVGAATTGIYLDDTPFQARNGGNSSTNAYPEVFDLQRVEVLRGPQGTLFGAGSEGGTVRFITPQPNLQHYEAYGRVEGSQTQGGDASGEAGLAVGGPIVQDKIGFRASAFYQQNGGWIDRVDRTTGNVVDADANRSTAFNARVALTFAPIDNLKITPAVYFQDQRRNDSGIFWLSLSNPSSGDLRNGNLLGSPGRDQFTLPTLNVSYNLGSAEFISNTSYLFRDVHNASDYSQFAKDLVFGSPFPAADEFTIGDFRDKQLAWTQEVRLQSTDAQAPFRWVVGAFYQWASQRDLQQTISPNFPTWFKRDAGVDYLAVFGIPLAKGSSLFTDTLALTDQQEAVFGQIDYRVLEKLTATVGVRVAQNEFSFNDFNAGPFGGTGAASGQQKQTSTTPKFGLTYQFDNATMAYVSASKGFRPGGAQAPVGNACQSSLSLLGLSSSPLEYNSDSVWSYEAGAKGRLFNNRLQLDGSVFQIDWKNRQNTIPLRSCGQTFIANLGDVQSRGFDLSFRGRVTDDFTLSGALGYARAEYTQQVQSGPQIVARDGTPLPDRNWVASLTAEYRFRALGQDGYFRADDQYQGSPPAPDTTLFGADPSIPQLKAINLVNLRLGWIKGDVEWSLFVKNAFNDQTIVAYGHDTNASPLFYGTTLQPRTAGVTVTYHY